MSKCFTCCNRNYIFQNKSKMYISSSIADFKQNKTEHKTIMAHLVRHYFSQWFDYGQNGLHFNSLLESHSCLRKYAGKKVSSLFCFDFDHYGLQLRKIRNPASQTTTIFQFVQFEQIIVQMVQIRCISYSRSVHATTITGKFAD